MVLAPKPIHNPSIDAGDAEINHLSSVQIRRKISLSLPESETSTRPSSDSTVALDAENYYLTIPGFSLCAALHNNARLLGISCLLPHPLASPPGTPSLPFPLHPTPLQMSTIHLPYIDCLPIAKLRHNLILLNGLVDEEEFCWDLVGTTSFVVMGSQSWDPEGWVLERGFKEKWSFLFD